MSFHNISEIASDLTVRLNLGGPWWPSNWDITNQDDHTHLMEDELLNVHGIDVDEHCAFVTCVFNHRDHVSNPNSVESIETFLTFTHHRAKHIFKLKHPQFWDKHCEE